ncbi:MAG: hypothetical protein R3A80_08795 [Bdellovibrionota bacterium]
MAGDVSSSVTGSVNLGFEGVPRLVNAHINKKDMSVIKDTIPHMNLYFLIFGKCSLMDLS